jgi:hypothetical protein
VIARHHGVPPACLPAGDRSAAPVTSQASAFAIVGWIAVSQTSEQMLALLSGPLRQAAIESHVGRCRLAADTAGARSGLVLERDERA